MLMGFAQYGIGGICLMKYRLVALDLDGTLLNSQKEITDTVKEAVAWAMRQGIRVVLSTGRIIGEAAEFARELDCEDLIITAGGAAIARVSDEQILESWNMPCETGAGLVAAVQDRPVRIMIYVGSKIYINPFSDRDFVQNYRIEGFHANKVVLEDIAARILQERLAVTKIFACGDRAELDGALETIRQLPGIDITSSGSDNFEIMPQRVHKGRALLRIGEIFGIHTDEMVAIGDSDNDAAMLRAVGMPVAMGNADECLFSIAKYVTADCDHDGVAHAIYALCK